MTVTVGFCAARSNSGKTTLLLRVLEELQRRGLKVAVLKHGRHLDGDEEKDSRRYAAQAAASLFVSPQGWTLEAHPEEELPLDQAIELICRLSGCQVLLIEGYKKAAIPKIAVCRQEIALELPCPEQELLAVVTDTPLDTALPQFGFDELPRLCDFILELQDSAGLGC